MNRSGAPAAIYSQPNTTLNLYCALSEPQWPQQANSHVTACKTAHVCIDVQAYRRVAKTAGMVNQRGDKITARWMISGLVLKYLNGEYFVIRRGYKAALPVSR